MVRSVLVVGVLAMACLAMFDYLIVAAAFLGRPDGGEWVLVAMAGSSLASFALRRGWIVLVAQNALLTISIAHASRGEAAPDAGDLVQLAGFVALGNVLAWPVARLAARWRKAMTTVP